MIFDKVKENLEKRGYKVEAFERGEDAVGYLNSQIDGLSVGIGGSVTVKELGLFDLLAGHNEVYWHWDTERLKTMSSGEIIAAAGNAEVYICSANGLSEDGRIVNIDGTGNRIASTAYGHKKVYFIIGKNKLADTLENAIWRAQNIAAPKNAQRLGVATPCAAEGDRCYSCHSEKKICRGTLIFDAPVTSQKTEIILIDEELGY